MALPAAPHYLYLLLILFLIRSISAYTPTTIRFYNDTACLNLLYTVQTNTDVFSGTCKPVSDVNSVYPGLGDSGCAVTVYSDIASPDCSNDTLAPFGQCTTLPIKSYTVDCSQINGTNTGNYTTIYASSGETSTPSATPPTATPSTTLSSTTETNPLISTNPTSSSLAASSSSQTSSVSSTGTTPSPSPSQAPKQSDGNGGLSRSVKIGLGTGIGVLGGVLGISVLVYSAQKNEKRRTPQPGSSDRDVNATQPSQERSTTRNSKSEGLVNGDIHQSDQFSYANSSFRSLPKERQGKLYD
ncbi:hypothetical protein ABVK25_011171 [Lepraria finkii]|uniref:Uncharacterized protein n=1 Tax=Lepraria finkii TaxID=1340010 RepID=A0ABR4ASV3_9LECA